ncbi:hypothetical protein LEP1GSC041_2915 [Leptospira noguchii str. 2006001870]|nr:hypothetical protein LEP1GSC041_2915 [Leptospira noguchii str. 2006001870]
MTRAESPVRLLRQPDSPRFSYVKLTLSSVSLAEKKFSKKSMSFYKILEFVRKIVIGSSYAD